MQRFAIILAAALGACTGAVEVRSPVIAPDLVEVSPDVQVVAEANEPVFYTDNAYWLYRGGGWYRSDSYRGGWIRIATPPPRLSRIDRPAAYAHFHRDGARTTAR